MELSGTGIDRIKKRLKRGKEKEKTVKSIEIPDNFFEGFFERLQRQRKEKFQNDYGVIINAEGYLDDLFEVWCWGGVLADGKYRGKLKWRPANPYERDEMGHYKVVYDESMGLYETKLEELQNRFKKITGEWPNISGNVILD